MGPMTTTHAQLPDVDGNALHYFVGLLFSNLEHYGQISPAVWSECVVQAAQYAYRIGQANLPPGTGPNHDDDQANLF